MSYERFDSESSYRSALRTVLDRAMSEIAILDASLAGMHAQTPAMVAMFEHFIAGNHERRVRIALHDTQLLTSDMPRLLALIQRFSITIAVRQIPDEYRHLADCHLLADRLHGVRRFHVDQPRGSLLLDDAAEVHPWWKRFDELWELSLPVSLIGTTGL